MSDELRRTVSVIVKRCVPKRLHGPRSYGDPLVEKIFPTVEDAMTEGNQYRADERCVIVRPNYNEQDEQGVFFREWQSFNSKPFEEVRWRVREKKSIKQ